LRKVDRSNCFRCCLNTGREGEDRRAAGGAFHASMLLKKKVERTLFVALIGFCKYGISDLDHLDHEDGVYTEKTSLGSKGVRLLSTL
jgi:hypothetical protein